MLSLSRALRWFAVAVGLTSALVACGDAGGQFGEPGSTSESAITLHPDLFPNDVTACDYFVAKGLTPFQAAGIVGNLDQESGVNPNAVQQGGPGRGIAQWSVGGRWDTDANDNAVAYASQHGQSVYSLQLQLDFIWYELTNFSGYGLSALKATTNVTDATVTFETRFEGCGQCDESQRIAYAEAVLGSCSPPPYAAQYVSQSFPLATTTMTMTAGEVIPSYIELKNVGSKTWDSNTRIGTTQPRDRHSVFADSSWVAPNRLAAVHGTVPPGGTYKFTFNLAAPATAGTYDEFFGVVQEGVAWFSDPGQGGPPDNDLEVKIAVKPAPVVDSGAPPHDAGSGTPDAGHGTTGGDAGHDAGGVSTGTDGGTGGGSGGGHGPGPSSDGGMGDAFASATAAGCSASSASSSSGGWWAGVLGLGFAVALVRRRRG